MKKIVIAALVAIGLAFTFWTVFELFFAPADLELVMPEPLESSIGENKNILVKIDRKNQLYINEIRTELNKIDAQIDSIYLAGISDSTIILENESNDNLKTMMELMNTLNKSNKKVILSVK